MSYMVHMHTYVCTVQCLLRKNSRAVYSKTYYSIALKRKVMKLFFVTYMIIFLFDDFILNSDFHSSSENYKKCNSNHTWAQMLIGM